MVGFREQNLFNVVDLMRCAACANRNTPKAGTSPEITWTQSSAKAGASGASTARRNTPNDANLHMNTSTALPFALPSGRKVALNAGASEKGRRWPAEYFARLAEGLAALGFAPILVGAPSDRDAWAAVQAASLAKFRRENFDLGNGPAPGAVQTCGERGHRCGAHCRGGRNQGGWAVCRDGVLCRDLPLGQGHVILQAPNWRFHVHHSRRHRFGRRTQPPRAAGRS
jgi:hypothetical protein